MCVCVVIDNCNISYFHCCGWVGLSFNIGGLIIFGRAPAT